MYSSRRVRRVRALSALAIAAAGGIVLSACSGGGGGETVSGAPAEVNAIIHTSSGAAWPTFVAEAKGFFEEEGLDVELTTVTPKVSTTAILSGSADIGMADTAEVIQAIEKDAPLTIVGQAVDDNPYFLMSAPGITKISQLSGKVIGGGSSQLDPYVTVLKEILQKNGVDPNDVDFVFGQGSSDRLAALQGGSMQATLLPSPTYAVAADAGFNILADTRDTVPAMTFSTVVANTNWAEANPAAAHGYIAALGKAAAWLNDPANEDSALRILQEAIGGDIKNAEIAYEDFVVPGGWDPSGCVQADALAALLKRMMSVGTAESDDPANYSTTEYC